MADMTAPIGHWKFTKELAIPPDIDCLVHVVEDEEPDEYCWEYHPFFKSKNYPVTYNFGNPRPKHIFVV